MADQATCTAEGMIEPDKKKDCGKPSNRSKHDEF